MSIIHLVKSKGSIFIFFEKQIKDASHLYQITHPLSTELQCYLYHILSIHVTCFWTFYVLLVT